MIAYTDFPRQYLVSYDADGLFDNVRDQFTKEVGGKVASEKRLTLDGHHGREMKIQIFRGEIRLRVFLVGDRLYLLSLMNMEKPFASDEEADKFFASFKLNEAGKRSAA